MSHYIIVYNSIYCSTIFYYVTSYYVRCPAGADALEAARPLLLGRRPEAVPRAGIRTYTQIIYICTCTIGFVCI